MWSLVRRDPYLQHARVYTLLAPAIAGVIVAIQDEVSPLTVAYLVLTVAVFPLLRSETFHRRFSEFQLTLPVPTERLARARLLAMLVAFGAPLLLVCAVMSFGEPRTRIAEAFGLMGSLALAVVAHNYLSMDSNAIRPYVWGSFVGILAAGIVATFTFRSEIYATSMLAIAALLGAVVWHRAPRWIPSGGERLSTRTGPLRMEFGSVTGAILLRETLGGPIKAIQSFLHWVFFPAFVLAPGGFDSGLSFGPLFALSYYLWSLRLSQVLHTLGHLPINRIRLGLALVLPGLILGTISILVAGQWRGDYWGWQKSHAALTVVEVVPDGDTYRADTDTPPTLWQFHLGFGDPLVASPRGEAHLLTSHRPIPLAPFALYNPYEIPEKASLGFAAWQVQRLVADAHGVEVTLDEIQRRYILRQEDGFVGERIWDPANRDFRPFDRDFEHAVLLGQRDVLQGSLVAFVLFWIAMNAIAFRPRQYPRVRLKWRNLTWSRIALAALGAFLIVSIVSSPGYDTAGVLRGAVFRSLGAWLPSSTWLAAIGFLVPTALAALWIASRIRKMDVPPPPAVPDIRWRAMR